MVGQVKHDFGLVNEGCGSVSSGCVGFGLFGLFGGFGVWFCWGACGRLGILLRGFSLSLPNRGRYDRAPIGAGQGP